MRSGAYLLKYPLRSILLSQVRPDFPESSSFFLEVLNLLGWMSAGSRNETAQLTILSSSLCFIQLSCISSFIVFSKQFANTSASSSTPDQDSLPKQISFRPDNTMNRFTGRSSDSTHRERLGRRFGLAIETFRLVLSRQLTSLHRTSELTLTMGTA